jgi:hypothetical protein
MRMMNRRGEKSLMKVPALPITFRSEVAFKTIRTPIHRV